MPRRLRLLFCALPSVVVACGTDSPSDTGDGGSEAAGGDAALDGTSVDAALDVGLDASPDTNPNDSAPVDVAVEAPLTCDAGLTICNNACTDTTSDPQNCAGCSQACPMRPNATVGCMTSTCTWACFANYVDLDGDLNLQPRTATSNGCECHVANTVDVPDLGFVDSNCDGIDGDVNKAIFVSPRGNDSNAGTMALPVKTVAKAITLASAAHKDVYAALGTYNESVTLATGVGIYGGYDDANKWSRAMNNMTTIQATTSTAIVGTALDTSLELQLLTVHAIADSTPGGSSYGVRIANSTNNAIVTVRGCTVVTADASSGVAGMNGAAGANGGNATSGGNVLGQGGAGGTSTCAANGGDGGPAVRGSFSGNPGKDGSGPSPGIHGAAGLAYGSCGIANTSGENAPDNATPGGASTNGTNAPAPPAIGAFDGAGTYAAVVAGGGTAGTSGSGGGGGGSGGGSSNICFFCCNDMTSGGGGGGGGGGCAGTPGTGGSGGGASVGVVAIAAGVTIDRTTITVGRGGDGGRGGNGGLGGAAGAGAGGGPAGPNAGIGAPGKNGSAGGPAGSGAGAPGGPSSCVAWRGTMPTQSAITCARAGGGAGGAGGSNTTLGPAPSGAGGASIDTLAL